MEDIQTSICLLGIFSIYLLYLLYKEMKPRNKTKEEGKVDIDLYNPGPFYEQPTMFEGMPDIVPYTPYLEPDGKPVFTYNPDLYNWYTWRKWVYKNGSFPDMPVPDISQFQLQNLNKFT